MTAAGVAGQRRALWVFAHPDPCSLSTVLRDEAIERLTTNGWHVDRSDLYDMGWNPLLSCADFPGETSGTITDRQRAATLGGTLTDDVAAEQDKLRAADLVVLQYPLWWYGVPAILKGWLDRVFSSGFAFDVRDPETGRARKYGDGGLVGKRALAVVAAGDRPGSIGPRGISGSIELILWPLLHGTFWYTGMDPLRPELIAASNDVSDARVDELRQRMRTRMDGITDEEPLAYLPMTEEFYDHSIALHPEVSPDAVGEPAHRRR